MLKKIKNIRLSMEKREALAGYLFCLPFILGFIFMVLYPFVQSIIFSLNRLEIKPDGYELVFVRLENYHRALFVNAEFPRILVETVLRMFSFVPLVLTFSFFAAILLNQKFKGRLLARLIFFLPVILAAEIVQRIEMTDYMTLLQSMDTSSDYGLTSILSMSSLSQFLLMLKLPQGLLLYIIQGVGRVSEVIRASGIQILIFLAGLQSIPASLYEAADVEGATGWENFWMITLPLLSPLILTNVVYTIVDFFISVNNPMIDFLQTNAFGGAGYGVAMAMSWIYFLVVGIIIMVTIRIISKTVFYME